jgi:hypothetical protein
MITTQMLRKQMRQLHPAPVLLRVSDISLPGHTAEWLVTLPDSPGTRHEDAWLTEWLSRHMGAEVTARLNRIVNRRDGGHNREYCVTVGASERQPYNPVSGEHWNVAAATEAWSGSMSRTGPRWKLDGLPPQNGGEGFYWSFFNFGPYTGKVTIEADGFHWETRAYREGVPAGSKLAPLIHSGVTTSVYVAYRSVELNRVVRTPVLHPTMGWQEPPRAEPSADDNSAR